MGIFFLDVRTKQEFDKMFREIDIQWKKQEKVMRRIMKRGF